jgi:hypothetical protein
MEELGPKSLDNNKVDWIVAATRGVVGAVPLVGSILGEVVSTLVPNQRVDRIVQYIRALESKLSLIPVDRMNELMRNEQVIDLLDNGFYHAARASSDERREYVATVIFNGINEEQIQYSESKSILQLLEELNDIELIWLRYYLDNLDPNIKEFKERHSVVLTKVILTSGADEEAHVKAAMQTYHIEHLERLNLLKPKYSIDRKTKQQVLDSNGNPKVTTYSVTPLGRLLLKQLGVLASVSRRASRPIYSF